MMIIDMMIKMTLGGSDDSNCDNFDIWKIIGNDY